MIYVDWTSPCPSGGGELIVWSHFEWLADETLIRTQTPENFETLSLKPIISIKVEIMGNKATTIEQQIDLLRERGMLIPNEDKAAEYLLDIGYYRLGFYWYHFEKDHNTHSFLEDTNLDDVIKLYYFDVDLRNLLSKYLYRIEVNFRTKLIYYTSNKYSDSPTWFQDTAIVEKHFLSILSKIYTNNFKKANLPIKKHHQKYINDKYAPAWKTIEFFTFGQTYRLFNALKDEGLKTEIAAEFKIKNMAVFKNYLRFLINLRNICSHSAVLFDYNQPMGAHKMPDAAYSINNRNRTNLNASLHVVLFMLSHVSVNRTVELRADLQSLFRKILENKNLKNVVMQTTDIDFIVDK